MNKICRYIFSSKITLKVQIRTYKLSLLGAAGGIGQPLGLFLKKTPYVTNLSLYDIKHAKGVAVDLSHIERKGSVQGYEGKEELKPCLENSDIVVICAGLTRKPGMSRNDLFQVNASVVAELMTSVAHNCPNALICIITNPINSIIPIAAAIMEHFGVFDRNKLFGVTTLDIVRAITFISKEKEIQVERLNVPIIGGHSETTLIPVMSQCAPPVQFPLEERNLIVEKIRSAGTAIVEAKAGQGSATLSMAWAAYRFINSLMEAKDGREGVIEPSYVKSDDTECEFFSTPLILGKNGIERNLGLVPMTEYEVQMLKTAIPEIKRDIQIGKKFAVNFLKNI